MKTENFPLTPADRELLLQALARAVEKEHQALAACCDEQARTKVVDLERTAKERQKTLLAFHAMRERLRFPLR
jgi:hypothetical protein